MVGEKMSEELSLLELYNKLSDQSNTYGEKILKLESLLNTTNSFPSGVTDSNDGPGLWSDNGLTAYAILDIYNLTNTFCTTGILLNISSGAYKFQLMLVETDDLDSSKVGNLYFRYADYASNSWSVWKRILNEDDLKKLTDDLNNGTFSVNNAKTADRLTTPRTITVSGAVTGSIIFDGSSNEVMNTLADGTVPLNINITAAFHQTDYALLICTLPVSSGNTYDYAIIEGHIGGWTANQGKAHITMCVSNRDKSLVNGMIIGTISGCDIVVYKDVDLQLKVYLICRSGNYTGNCKLSVYGSQVVVNNSEVPFTFTGTNVFTLSTDAAIFTGKTFYGTLAGGASTALSADLANKVNVTASTGTKAFITSTTGSGTTLLFDPNIYVDKTVGTITANNFEGHLKGNADTATEAVLADNIQCSAASMTKAYVLGTTGSGTKPIYDPSVYLDTVSGRLTTSSILTSSLFTSNLSNSGPSTFTGTVQFNSGLEIYGNTPYIDFHFGNSSADYTSRIIEQSQGTITVVGNLNATKVYNAIWNDYAEYFQKGEETNPGDVIMLNMNSNKEEYVKSSENAKLVVGVHSDEYGHIIGGDLPPDGINYEEYNSKKYIPVALAGRVKVNFIGKSSKGSKIVATNDGCSRLYDKAIDDIDDVFGYLVEDDDVICKRRLKIKIK